MELARRVREATRPILLVADYAETRPEEITALADILASSPPAHPVRVCCCPGRLGPGGITLPRLLARDLDITGSDWSRSPRLARHGSSLMPRP